MDDPVRRLRKAGWTRHIRRSEGVGYLGNLLHRSIQMTPLEKGREARKKERQKMGLARLQVKYLS